jgi:hypothetical protein
MEQKGIADDILMPAPTKRNEMTREDFALPRGSLFDSNALLAF